MLGHAQKRGDEALASPRGANKCLATGSLENAGIAGQLGEGFAFAMNGGPYRMTVPGRDGSTRGHETLRKNRLLQRPVFSVETINECGKMFALQSSLVKLFTATFRVTVRVANLEVLERRKWK
jgi:hypothetical protein